MIIVIQVKLGAVKLIIQQTNTYENSNNKIEPFRKVAIDLFANR